MANLKGRIKIPKNADDLIKLAENISAKHTADGANSPLAKLNMTDLAAKATTAKTNHTSAQALQKQAEKATENRNVALGTKKGQKSSTPGTVLFYVTSVRDMLLGLNKGNEQALGDYGFVVDKSPKASSASAAAKKAAKSSENNS